MSQTTNRGTFPYIGEAMKYLAAIVVGSILGVWGCVISAHDDHILTVGQCMNRTANERNVSHQEAWLICERQ
jgi:hypothetical protein